MGPPYGLLSLYRHYISPTTWVSNPRALKSQCGCVAATRTTIWAMYDGYFQQQHHTNPLTPSRPHDHYHTNVNTALLAHP